MFYVYVLRSRTTGRLYTGYSADVEHRLGQHNCGISRSTKHDASWELVHSERIETRRAARQRERFLKTGRGREAVKKLLATPRSSR